jgi:pimeloyl-ACP methyl ester carboxylesterase
MNEKSTPVTSHRSPAEKRRNSRDAFLQQYSFHLEVNGKRLRIFYKKHILGNEVPLILFLHGFNGSLEQYREQLLYFDNRAHVLAIDLVGHGQSDTPIIANMYTAAAMVEDLRIIFEAYQSKDNVIVAHAYGCSLATQLYPLIKESVRAMVFISVCSQPPPLFQKDISWILHIPHRLLTFKRHYRGIIIMNRYIHEMQRHLQRLQSLHRPYWLIKIILRRMVWAAEQEFKDIHTPLLLLTGEKDRISPPEDTQCVATWCQPFSRDPHIIPHAGHHVMIEKELLLNAIINKFLIEEVALTGLDLKEQLLRLNTTNDFKWSLKNIQKWAETTCVSDRVKGTLFRPMKVMRQIDSNHSPQECFHRYPQLGLILDVSSGEPPYDTTDPALKNYYKLPTESKKVPSQACCQHFICVADTFWKTHPHSEIGVHCHYGFNRTGFLICTYLIERCHCSVKEALRRFAEVRPPGIKHQYFRDELALRYI